MSTPTFYTDAQDVGHLIDGQVTAPTTGRFADVHNPTTGQVARRVHLAEPDTVDAAVRAAQAAFPAWADTPPIQRARVMQRFLALLNAHRDELAAMITSEHGKVFTDAQGEVTRGIEIGRAHV